jgi:glutamate racemase
MGVCTWVQEEVVGRVDPRPIGFFDSGEGGLTVARAVAARLRSEDLVYACDTAHFPYGPKPLAEVRLFLLRFMEFFAAQNCKLVVVACNTATAAALDLLEDGLPVPAIGVVLPGARAAARQSLSGRIGVAATQGTCDSGIYRRFILAERPGALVFQEPCPILVIRAEEGVISGPAVQEEVRRCLAPMLEANVDTLVLGCTHFPHMRAVIEEVVGPYVRLVDPGLATADAISARLTERGLLHPDRARTGERRFFTTGDPTRFTAVAARLWPQGRIREAHQIKLV